jgi:hypothetical protein
MPISSSGGISAAAGAGVCSTNLLTPAVIGPTLTVCLCLSIET